jgi:hypothetical protein
VQTAVEKKRFNPKKPNREDRPHTDYRVHPPIRENAEPAPELGLLDYVNAGRANQQDPDPRLRDEAALDRLEGCQPVGTQFTAADRRQQRRGHDRNATDPNNHCENMQGAGEDKAVHLRMPTILGNAPYFGTGMRGHGADQGRLQARMRHQFTRRERLE